MNTRTQRCVLSVGLVALASLPGWAAVNSTEASGPDQPAAPSNTYQASCLLKITWDPDTLPLGDESLNMLVESSGVAGQATHEVLGQRVHEFGRNFDPGAPVQVEFAPADFTRDAGKILAKLAVVIDRDPDFDVKPAAEELMTAIARRLRATLHQANESDLQHLHERFAQAEQEVAEIAERLDRLQELRRRLCDEAGRADLSREDIVDELRGLELTRREIQMQRAAEAARRKALEEQIARIGQGLETRVDEDPVVTELEKVVKLHELHLNRMRELIANRTASEAELASAQERVAMAKVHLFEQRQRLLDQAGAGRLAEFNNHLTDVSIDAAEIEARLSFITQQIDAIRAR
ncbi:MAG: hypothetical protein GY778_30225, partial [bacterium]|nr:hypothetical protein [bacterium]